MTEKTAPSLGIKYGYSTGESGWGAGYNANHLLFDALLQLSVKSAALATPPGSPADGDRYIVAASPTGAWVGHAKAVAAWLADTSAWRFYAPAEGWSAYAQDVDTPYRYNGSAWVAEAVDTSSFATTVSVSAAITAAIAGLVDTAPGTLDTLNELAAALGDDPNFAATLATALALKAPLASPALTGTPTAPTASPGTGGTQIATQAYADAAAAAAGGSGGSYTLPAASSTTRGGVTVAVTSGLSLSGDALTVAYGTAANTAAQGNDARLPPAPTGNALLSVRANSAGTALEYYSVPYDVTLYAESTMTNAEVILRMRPRAAAFPSGAAGSYADAGTAATGSFTLTAKKNGVAFGTFVWSAAGTVAAVTISSTTTFNGTSDILTLEGAATADATLANITVTLAGSRS